MTKVEARNAAGNILILPFGEPVGGIYIKEIDGLDPVPATIVTSSFATQDGEQYQSARRPARNLILKLGFAPDWESITPKTIRDNLYKWFMTKRMAELRFYEDTGLVVSITGRCESNESPRFRSDPDAIISMYCFQPDFVGMTPKTISGESVSSSSEITAIYDGTEDTGFVFTMNVNRTISGFALHIRGEDGVQYTMDFAMPEGNLVSGDILKISTVPGNKYATVTRSGSTTNLLYAVSPSSPWLTLQPGQNKIRLYVAGSGGIPFTIQYSDKYGGL